MGMAPLPNPVGKVEDPNKSSRERSSRRSLLALPDDQQRGNKKTEFNIPPSPNVTFLVYSHPNK